MAQAAKRFTIVPRPEDSSIGRAARSLESSVCNIEHMAAIVSDMFAGLFDDMLNDQIAPLSRQELLPLSKDVIEKHQFAVNHLWHMTFDFKKAFYAALDGRSAD